uniref:TNF receptor-associated factor 2-like n=1 Tax=Saccoglossus kowalevskii TaxID=10224 RepID=A0ABM0MDY2_SACKO
MRIVFQIFPDNATKRELRVKFVECPNKKCGWKGNFRNYEGHYDVCAWLLILCNKQGCDEMVIRGNLASHLENECLMRIVQCQFCEVKIVFKNVEKHHMNECPLYPVKCQYCGRDDFTRDKLKLHQDPTDGDCEKKLVLCTYSVVGCEEQIQAEDLVTHLENRMLDHQEQLLHNVLKVHGFVESNKKDKEAMQQLFSQFEDQEKQSEKIKKRCAQLEKDISNVLENVNQ